MHLSNNKSQSAQLHKAWIKKVRSYLIYGDIRPPGCRLTQWGVKLTRPSAPAAMAPRLYGAAFRSGAGYIILTIEPARKRK